MKARRDRSLQSGQCSLKLVTLLIDVCKAVIQAEVKGKLAGERYAKIARQAHIIVSASAKAGIKGLVYALAGYNPTAEEVIAAFKTCPAIGTITVASSPSASKGTRA